jgi:putative phosphoesterase
MSNAIKRIGVISDTHGKLDEAVLHLFEGVYRIIHAGDIGDERILWELENIAPVIAVRGNNDPDSMVVPVERLAVIDNTNIFVLHQFAAAEKLSPGQRNLIETRLLDVVVFGHSHKPYQDTWRGTLLFNPGSAGPKRFSLPRTVGFLEIAEGQVKSEIVELTEEPCWLQFGTH